MSVHKLTAGDGYTYLTRQVAVQDATDRGASGLADYYAEKGESPGRWWGSGLLGVGLSHGATVSEAQMKSLFGEGRHPDAASIREILVVKGAGTVDAERATRLGQPFRIATGATEFAQRVAAAYVEHNLAGGVAWSDPIDPATRAGIRTRVADALFLERYGRGPADDRERHGFVAQESRQRTHSVAGFDLTFTPVKSVSALWALADSQVAAEIEQAHAAAVQHTLGWLEEHVLFTRRGHRGVRQVRTRGLIAAAFTHRDSRAGDPNLHTHVAVSNKVQDEEGQWLAVDGRVLFKANVTLSEHYNTRLEAELTARLGLRFEEPEASSSRGRPVREVAGVDPRLSRTWSSRRHDIDIRRNQLSTQFQHDHGRPPTPTESIALGQQANLETRQEKHAPRSEAEQRAAWASEARQILGSSTAVTAMVGRCLREPSRTAPDPSVSREWVEQAARQVVHTLEGTRATWQLWHLRAEAERQARYAGVPLDRLEAVIGATVQRAIQAESVALPDPDLAHAHGRTPPPLRRPDGSSVYAVHGSQRFTSRAILDAERSLLDAAGRCDGRAVAPVRVHRFLMGWTSDRDGSGLSTEQEALVVRLAGSSQRVQVALAPAGSGKTRCMRALADLWLSDGGRVVGLAPSAAAAHQLQASLCDEVGEGTDRSIAGVPCDTLAKVAWGMVHPDDAAGWASTIGPATMVIIDEAAMAGTIELAAVVRLVVERGGCVRLVGDDRQLAAVAAGGIVRDIADRYGAATLSETRRFHDPVEGAATLALRSGDPVALGFYADNGRLHVGDAMACAEQAYAAWKVDLTAGRSSILLAPTRELARELNLRAQRDRLEALRKDEAGHDSAVELFDGARLRVGDQVITRRNDRRLSLSNTDWVRNGDRWTVRALGTDGSATLTSTERRRHVTVPSSYVTEHLTLGYATTIHGAQGLTVDTAHTVLTGDEDRSLLYVGLTRGRHANHVYVTVLPHPRGPSGDGADAGWHDMVTRPEVLDPPTAVEVLTGVMAREDQAKSATTTLRSEPESDTGLHDQLQAAADRYRDALYVAAEDLLGAQITTRIGPTANQLVPGIVDQPAWETLRANLLLAAVIRQTDPADLLARLVRGRPVIDTRDAAAVLAARLGDQDISSGDGTVPAPAPWLPAVPEPLANHPSWGTYLDLRRTWVIHSAARLAQAVDTWPLGGDHPRPSWARPLLTATDATLLGDLAVWRAIEGIDATDLDPAGSTNRPGAPGHHQADLRRRVAAAASAGTQGAAPENLPLPPEVRNDPQLPHLRARLDEMTASGTDVRRALQAAASDQRPLPTETPAAALWWRTLRHAHSMGTAMGTTFADDPPLIVRDAGPDPRWAIHSPTNLDRIVELHHLALRYYADMYDRSWAPSYLTQRFYEGWNHDLSGLRPGYAPPGPQSLIRQLRSTGATDQELLDAGLACKRELPAGGYRIRDTFRDRLVFPIHDPRHPDQVIGFVGRRNPTKDADERNGPKYLNTRSTSAYAKSDSLFGLDQLALHPHAMTAVVEGPLDAIAVTLASQGAVVGVSPLGTSLTDDQTTLLAEHLGRTNSAPLLIFDADEAGDAAAERAATSLLQTNHETRRVALPRDTDPCQLLSDYGPQGLAQVIGLTNGTDPRAQTRPGRTRRVRSHGHAPPAR
ncbi:MobF family relaxase [Nocardioides marmotae]|nr:MobF family relaxase [Nocardioides marmotae]MBC9735534.1 relaxase domain-containing protein [Nocardioides marmotae]